MSVRRLELAPLQGERDTLRDLRDAGRIDDIVLRPAQEVHDVEEVRLGTKAYHTTADTSRTTPRAPQAHLGSGSRPCGVIASGGAERPGAWSVDDVEDVDLQAVGVHGVLDEPQLLGVLVGGGEQALARAEQQQVGAGGNGRSGRRRRGCGPGRRCRGR